MRIKEEIRSEFQSKSPLKKPTEEITLLLQNLYEERRLSQVKIGKLLGVQTDTIGRWLRRCNIPLRNRYDAVSIYLTKYKTSPFSRNKNEEAYLIGLRTGDLSAQKHGRKIRLSVSTTHPAMLNLFKDSFNRYGKVNFYPKHDKIKRRYLTCVYCDLDQSFKFLTLKAKNIPAWILKNNEHFMSFLSGYFDAEGCISLGKNRSAQFIIKSCDKGILDDLSNKLNSMGLNLNLRLEKKADHKTYNMDYWYLGTGNRLKIIKLLKLMKIKHKEKTQKSKLLNKRFSFLEVQELRKQIKKDVARSMTEAQHKYSNTHAS